MSASARFLILLLGVAGIVLAANAQTPTVHADPMDTVGVQASVVCATLAESPSVFTIESEVRRLLATYTEASENRVMAYAMNTLCPQYQYLAIAALQGRMAAIQGGGTTV